MALMSCDYLRTSVRWWLPPDHQLWRDLVKAVGCRGSVLCRPEGDISSHSLVVASREEGAELQEFHQSGSRVLCAGEGSVRLPVEGKEDLATQQKCFFRIAAH